MVKMKDFNFFYYNWKGDTGSALLAGKLVIESWATREVVQLPWGHQAVRKPKPVYVEVPHEQTWYYMNKESYLASLSYSSQPPSDYNLMRDAESDLPSQALSKFLTHTACRCHLELRCGAWLLHMAYPAEVSAQPFCTRNSGLKCEVQALCTRPSMSKWN